MSGILPGVMRCHLRRILLSSLVLLAPGCVNFHPLYPTSGAKDPSGKAEDAAASAEERPSVTEPIWQMVGQSVKGRPIRVTTVGYGSRRVLWIGSIHGDEVEGKVATQRLPEALRLAPDALSSITLTIMEDANPDGTAMNMRRNANGVDLNRNFPAANFKPHRIFGIRPLSQPEARAVHDLIVELKPDLVIVAHSWRGDRFINFDGPAENLALRFSRLSGYPMRSSSDMSPTPGSLGSWVGNSLGVPILTLEYRRGREPMAAWLETKEAILAVLLNT